VSHFTLEPGEINDFGPCDCCGHNSRTVQGFVYRHGDAYAIYYVHWTVGGVSEHGAHFDLVLGEFGDGIPARARFAVSLEFRRAESGPAFMVIDATTRPISKSELVGRALSRSEVVGTPIAKEAFDVIDAVWLQDERISEISGGPTMR
jgi:hypothetical protein